jgi:dihydrofolate reductase
MSIVKVSCVGVSIDGFSAGPRQSLENPLGVGGPALMAWAVPTRTMQQKVFGAEGGETGIDDDFAARGFANTGAWILGRHMFGPVRGPWVDDAWRGWWGDSPPYQVPVFVLTHHPRASIEMAGGTTFHFVTEGIEHALRLAKEAAGARDVRIGGGAATIRQYLQAGLVDELHLALAPALLGTGEPLLAGIDLKAIGFECTEHAGTTNAMHVVLTRRGGGAR